MSNERIIIERNIEIPMRDGVLTRADLYRPDKDGPLPTILVRTPYDKSAPGTASHSIEPLRGGGGGFAGVFQDTRGRYTSDGEFYPYRYEAEDGYDSVEWAASQPWSNGRIGMTGLSYLGAVQWLAATMRPPHLKAIVPITIGSEHYMDMMSRTGGAFKHGYLLFWGTAFVAPERVQRRIDSGTATADDLLTILQGIDGFDGQVSHRPLKTVFPQAGNPALEFYFDWMERKAEDSQNSTVRNHYQEIDVPALVVGGWYDYFLDGTLENFRGVRHSGATEAAREGQRLLIGPWSHALGSTFGDVDFGVFASTTGVDFYGMQTDHFARHLTDSVDVAPWRVRIYVMGENVWRDEDDWPLARAEERLWYLGGDGTSKSDAGTLMPHAPNDELSDAYLYNPHKPSPTIGGATGLPGLIEGSSVGPHDQRPVESRSDVLVYSSPVLAETIEVTGPVRAVLYASSSALDTDFIVRLCDVAPDGTSRILTEGVIRAQYREGLDSASLLEPNQIYKYDIDMVATSNVFMLGHRIRVDVTSSSFPWIEPNPNTGHAIGEDGYEDLRVALQTVFHDATHPSHVVLPMVPR